MDSIKLIEGKNFADKLSSTQQEIRSVEDKYNVLIAKALKFRDENEKALSPVQKKEIETKVTSMEVERDAQVKQVLTQAEQKFAKDVLDIHEKLRVARMSVTARQVYEVNQKYDDARKEILDAIIFAYDEEVKAANGNMEKVAAAEAKKVAARKAVAKDLEALAKAQKEEVTGANKLGDAKFDEALNALKLKGDKDLAKGKEKIQLEVNAKYKKLLDDSLGNDKEVARIKRQMEIEVGQKTLEAAKETTKKVAQESIAVAQTAVNGIGSIFQMMDQQQADSLKKDEDANTLKKTRLDSQLKAGLITKKNYDTQVEKLDADILKKRKKLEHDQAVHAKDLALFNAMISVAQAVATALTAGPVSGIVMSIITAALGAVQIGYILSQKVPEADSGRYNVIGASDNKRYNNVPMVSSPATGLYSSPTLISETGSEIVIDPRTTRNLMINYPGVISAINYARVPQRATGSYLTEAGSQLSGQSSASAGTVAITDALTNLNSTLSKGVRSFIVYDDIRDASSTINTIENNVKST